MIPTEQSAKMLEILENESHSLKYFAYISGFEPFTFYRSSNLSGLDLTNQDLRGLNFDRADLRGAILDNISYDVGAFNNSTLNENYQYTDHFDCYFDDLLLDHIDRLYIFARIRNDLIDKLQSITHVKYSQLAEIANVSNATLRKARRGDAIALESARRVGTLLQKFCEPLNRAGATDILRQPSIGFLVSNTSGLMALPRGDFLRYLDIAIKLYELRKTRDTPSYFENWRDGTGMLDWYNSLYFDTDHPITVGEKQMLYEDRPLDFGLFGIDDLKS